MELRPYQQEAVNAVWKDWNGEHQRTLLVLPTGCGKTIVFSKIAEDAVRRGMKVLILAHRGELLDQAADKLRQVSGLQCVVEKAKQTSAGDWHRVVLGSMQTMAREARLERFSPDEFQAIIVDEAHHALSDGYQRILSYFQSAKVLGVTATPDRGDFKNLGQYFQNIAYEYSLAKAIVQGYLAPIRVTTIPLKLDLTTVHIAQGDFQAGDLGNALDPYLEMIAVEMSKVCMSRKTVVFLPLIATSQKFRDILNSYGFRAAEVNGSSEDRAEVLKDFNDGKYNVLCNSMLLTEGWDCPSVDCVVVLRPTKVRSLYAQMVGRGTRLHPGKDHLLLLDFLWNSERHELIRPAHLICEDPTISKEITKVLETAPGMDLFEAQEEAESRDAQMERENALQKAIAENKNKKRKTVDLVYYAQNVDSSIQDYQPAFQWEMDTPTREQLLTLEANGIDPGTVHTRGLACALISSLIERTNLATPAQVKTLSRYHFQNVNAWSKQAAGKMISRLSMNRWRIPAGVDPTTYRPNGG